MAEDFSNFRRSRLKSPLNPVYKPEKYGRREKDYPIACNACGYRENRPWQLGDLCPKCQSEKFYPVVHIFSRRRVMRIAAGSVLCCVLLFLCVDTTRVVVGEPTQYQVKLICSKDRYMYTDWVLIDKDFPIRCDKRRHWLKKTAYPAYECENAHVFPLMLDEKMMLEETMQKIIAEQGTPGAEAFSKPGMMPAVECPICQSRRTSRMRVGL